jgi:YHS domain-containing protein
MKTLFRAAALAALSLTVLAAPVATPAAYADKPPVYQPLLAQYAVDGFDLVSYFQGTGTPVRGTAAFTHRHAGVTYRFANGANRDAFAANPARFLPQFGGYCAWAVSQGYTAPGNPRFYRVVDGKLYLNYDARVQRDWERDIPGFIAAANRNWPAVLR